MVIEALTFKIFQFSIWFLFGSQHITLPRYTSETGTLYNLNMNVQKRENDESFGQRVKSHWAFVSSCHQAPLLCVSSLACLWGGGQRSSSAGLNILFTNTLLDTHTHTTDREHHEPTTCVWFAFVAPHCPSVRCPSFACFTCVCAQCWRHSPLSLNLLCVESEHLRKR